MQEFLNFNGACYFFYENRRECQKFSLKQFSKKVNKIHSTEDKFRLWCNNYFKIKSHIIRYVENECIMKNMKHTQYKTDMPLKVIKKKNVKQVLTHKVAA